MGPRGGVGWWGGACMGPRGGGGVRAWVLQG